MQNQQLAEALHKPNIRKFEKRKVYSSFIDNIWDFDLAEMKSFFKLIKQFIFYYVFLMLLVHMYGLFF